MPLRWQSIGIGQVSASFKINYIGIGLASKKWYQCITNKWASLCIYLCTRYENFFRTQRVNRQHMHFKYKVGGGSQRIDYNSCNNICDPVCEKGSYSLFNCTHLTAHTFTCEFGITLQFCPLVPLT